MALWLLLYAASLIGYNASYAFTRDVLIYHSQVRPATWIAARTLPDRPVWHDRTSLMTTGIVMEIRRGCDGVEAWLLLVTAFMVFPNSWRRRLRAILYGTVLIFTLNLIRIVSMLHIVIARPQWFDIAHGLVWQSIMVLSAAVFVLAQMEFTPDANITKTQPLKGAT
jgi:exosortase family protein XrtM